MQDALGRPTELRGRRDLRTLVARTGFSAPLGVFATEGDVGPPCREVFQKTHVRCLTDESAIVTLPSGRTLQITGLSRGRGRTRDSALLARMIGRDRRADHRIVISHSPDFVDALPERVDLALAGHTHGGQFVLPLFGPLVTAQPAAPPLRRGPARLQRHPPARLARRRHGARLCPARSLPLPARVCVLDVRWPSRRAPADLKRAGLR